MIITAFNSVKRVQGKRHEYEWADLCERLADPKRLEVTAEQLYRLNQDNKVEERKYKDIGGYTLGTFKGSKRNKNATKSRCAAAFDLDNLTADTTAAITEALNDSGLNYVIHSTAKHTKDKPRLRVIIPFSGRIRPESYSAVAKQLAENLSIPIDDDTASWEAERLMFWPSVASDQEYFFKCRKDGEEYTPEPIKDPEPVDTPPPAAEPPEGLQAATIAHEDAIDIMRKYVEKDSDNLQDRGNWLSAQMVLLKELRAGVIEQRTAEECAVILAGDNEGWQAENLNKLQDEIKKGTAPRTEANFMSKFAWQPEPSDPVEDFKPIEDFKLIPRRAPSTAADLQNANLPPIKFLIADMVPEGLGFLAGAPKAGKSFLAIQMCYCVAAGRPFLGRKTKQAPALYYSLEMTDVLIQSRLEKMYPNEPWPYDLYLSYDLPPYENGALQAIENDIIQTGAELVVVDTHAFIAKTISNQKSQYEESVKELTGFKKLADRLGVSIILVKHTNKNGQTEDPFDRMMGSQGNRGTADFNMLLERRKEDKDQLTLKEESRKSERNTDDVLERKAGGTFQVIGTVDELDARGEREEYEDDPTVSTVKRLMEERGELNITAAELLAEMPEAEQLKLSAQKIGRRLQDLRYNFRRYDSIHMKRPERTGARRAYVFTRSIDTLYDALSH